MAISIKQFLKTQTDSGTARAPVTYCAYTGEQVFISGGKKLALQWKPWRDGIMQAPVTSATPIDQLFVNGKRQMDPQNSSLKTCWKN